MNLNLKFFDEEAQEYCEGIVVAMVSLFSISENEAIKRISSRWSHLESIGGKEELIYHETEEHWANDIYYGHDSNWWLSKEVRESLDLAPLKPLNI